MLQLKTQTGIKYSPKISLGEPDVVLTILSDLSLAPNFNEQIQLEGFLEAILSVGEILESQGHYAA
jgi:hypothetical protein